MFEIFNPKPIELVMSYSLYKDLLTSTSFSLSIVNPLHYIYIYKYKLSRPKTLCDVYFKMECEVRFRL
jgi:hypothetical protein